MSANLRVSVLPVVFLASLTAIACDRSRGDSASIALDQSSIATAPRPLDAAAAVEMSTSKLAAPTAGAVAGVPAAFGERSAQVPAVIQQDVSPGSMLVRTGQASLQVDSLETGIARIREAARRIGAVIANTSMAGGRDQTRAASLELRIPSNRFDEAVNGLSPIGKVESVNVSVQDVGEEYVDVQARIANARRLEQRLVELLANRTGKLSDVLTVERELARVREEIERYEGRMRYLRSRASVSTLSIAIHEPYPIVAERPGTHPIRDAFIQAWRNLIGVTAGIIASLGVIIPLGVLVVAIILIGRRWLPTRGLGLTTNATGTESA